MTAILAGSGHRLLVATVGVVVGVVGVVGVGGQAPDPGLTLHVGRRHRTLIRPDLATPSGRPFRSGEPH